MMHVFDKNGNLVACSVISVDANVVAQLKTASSDGYNAVQIGADVVQAPEKPLKSVSPKHYSDILRSPEDVLVVF